MTHNKKTSRQLILSQARAGRIAARVAEEAEAAGIELEKQESRRDPAKLAAFLERIAWSRRTFEERKVPGQALMLEFGRVKFNWRTYAFLTCAKEYANANAHLPECVEFLSDLDSRTGRFYFDPTASEAIGTFWFTAFHEGVEWKLTPREGFDLARIVGWKNADGTPRYDPDHWQSNRWRNVIAAGFKAARG